MRSSPGLWLWLAALLHPRPAHAAVNEYVLASSPPGRVDGASIHFTDVLPTGAVVKWAVPPLGDWGLPIVGYRLRMSTERDFPKTLSPTHAPVPAGDAMDPTSSAWEDVAGVSAGGETSYQVRLASAPNGRRLPSPLYTPCAPAAGRLFAGADVVPHPRPRARRALPHPGAGVQPGG